MLKIVEGSSEPVELGERATLGRSQDCDLQIKDVESSRVHAEVFARDGQYHVRDLGSSNGTLLNGTEVEECVLKHGDRIQIGVIVVQFADDVAEPDTDDEEPSTTETDVCDLQPSAVEGERDEREFVDLPGYTITERLTSDDVTETYRATDDAMDRTVGIEVINEHYCDDAEAVTAKIRVAARLQYSGVARIYATGNHDEIVYFAREPVIGQSLWRLCGKLSASEATEAAAAVASSMAEAHNAGVVHGSIRPDRIVRTNLGHYTLLGLGLPTPDIGDLSTEPDLQKHPNRIAYMAPEQLLGKVSPAADVYSLGATLYHVICGRVPFGTISEEELAPKIASESIIPVRQLRPNIPEPLASLVEQMISRDPGDRPASMDDVQTAFEDLREASTRPERSESAGDADEADLADTDVMPAASEQRSARTRESRGMSASGCLVVILTILLAGSVFLLSRLAGEGFIRGDWWPGSEKTESYEPDADGSTPTTTTPPAASNADATP